MLLIFLAAATIATSPAAISPRAQEILEKVTDKISQMADQLKKVYVGKIKTVGTTSLVITTSQKDRTISTNEATSFYRIRAGNRTEINFKNLKVGDDISAVGTIEATSFEMTARQIIVKVHRQNVVGTIETNEANVITVRELGGSTIKANLSDAPILKKNLGTVWQNAKLSDFKTGSIVCLIAYSDNVSPNLLVLKAVILNL
jgi:hypothetical protein